MRPSAKTIRHAALGSLIAVSLGATPAALAAGGSLPLQIDGWAVLGDQLQISIVNLDSTPHSGVVAVRILSRDGRAIDVAARVAVAEGQKVFVTFDLPSGFRTVCESRVIVDDGSPF